jgi:hypothetical protein
MVKQFKLAKYEPPASAELCQKIFQSFFAELAFGAISIRLMHAGFERTGCARKGMSAFITD